MLDLLFVAMFQAAAGEPAPPLPTPDVTPAVEPGAPAADGQEAAPTLTRRCRKVRVTGSMISQRVCRTVAYEEERSERATRELNTIIDRPDFPGGGFRPAAGN